MEDMFGFSLRRTYELLLEQMKQARLSGKVQINYIVLVGGLAESPYMFDKIQTFAEGHGLQAIRPPNAWSSIVRGAVVKGLEGGGRAQIKNRKCRRHYGTACSYPFRPSKHQETDGYICSFTGTKWARYQVSWMLKKGQDLSTNTDTYAKMSMNDQFWSQDKPSASVDLLASDEDRAPQRSKDKVSPHTGYGIMAMKNTNNN
jgi:molecular chaperone DnaK (HSP70)